MKRLHTTLLRLSVIFAIFFAGHAVHAQNACNPGRIYDQIQSSFHTTIATRPNGTYTIWGEYAQPNGNTNHLTPVDITPANGYAYTGTPLFASLGSNSANSVQMFMMTTTGLYAWGSTNRVVRTAMAGASAFGSIPMPTGVAPTDVKQMLATDGALAIVTTTGEVWMSGTNAVMHGNGGTLPGAPYWAQVTTSAAGNPVLTGVTELRITPKGAFAITASGTWYTWGPGAYTGDGTTAAASLSRATPMTAAFAGTPLVIAATAGSGNGGRVSYFAVNPADHKIYAMGDNEDGQLGQNNYTEQRGWVTVKLSTGPNVDLTDVILIAANDQDGSGFAAVGAVTSTEHLYLWGSNDYGMTSGTATDYSLPRSPNGFTFGTDVPLYVEVGGHTSAYLKECADRYCYVGHKIRGSMGDGVSAGSEIRTFDCLNTPQALICGASSFDGGDVPVSYENNQAAAHYYRCPPGIFFGTQGPTSNNGSPANVAPGADNMGTNGDGLEEDGVSTLTMYTGSGSYSFDINATNTSGSAGYIYGWIDWNGNGIFETSEYQTATIASQAGAQTKTLTWTVPAVTCGKKYMRIRITNEVFTDNGATAIDERSIGASVGGEVEDYFVQATVPTSAGVDQHLVCNSQAVCGATMAGIGLGIWTAAPGNPGTVTIAVPGSNTTTVNNFSAPGTYYMIWTSGTCIDTMRITFNVKPEAVNDNVTTPESTPITINMPGNDTDFDGNLDVGSVTLLTMPTHGTAVLNAITGQVLYTPNTGYNGTDTYMYRICDTGTPVLCDTAVVTITISPVNDAPVAINDVNTTAEETAVNGNVSTNDSDVDGPALTFSNTTTPANGTLVFNSNGTYTYTPNTNFTGTDVFTYQVCDGGTPNLCATATVTLTVTPVNDPPVANSNTVSTNEDTAIPIDVLANDNDIDGALVPGTVAVGTAPLHGTTAVNPVTGVITYTPNPNYTGTDSFIYQVCDNGTPLPSLCDTAIVYITVTAVNDAPVAVNDVNTTPEETAVNGNVSTNDSDVDGPTLIFSNTSTPANGTLVFNSNGTYTYTPNTNFTGTDVFTYQVCDGGTPNLCAGATVTLTVTPVNDAPVANPDNAVTNEDTPVLITVLANDNDVDGTLVPNTVTVGTQPANGTVSINSVTGEITYTPNPNFSGTDSFIYQVCDNGTPLPSLCDTAIVRITVNAVNDAPVAVNDVNSTPEETAVNGNVSTNDTDVDGPSLSFTNTSTPANGTLVFNNDGTYTYTPNANFTGTDVFTYRVCDGGTPNQCATATVTLTVTPVNDPPVAIKDDVSTNEDTPVVIAVLGNDSDIDGALVPGSVATVVPPANGTISINALTGEVTYTPNPNFTGTDTFSYQVCDNGTPLPALCDTALVTVTVNPVNDAPVAVDDVNTTPEETAVNGNVAPNDSDVDGPGATYTLVTGPANGTLVFNNNGTYTYTPGTDFTGTDVFTYSLCDGGTPNQCDTAVVTLTVTPVNDAPVANPDNTTTPEDTPVVINVTGNDSDVDGSLVPNSVTIGTQPAHGTVTVNGVTGEITYTPNPNYTGTDSFVYQICDNGTPLPALCDTALVTVTVTPANDAPLAVNDANSTPEDTPVSGDVSPNDSDIDGPGATFAVVTGPANGTLVLNTDGTYTYTPSLNFTGTDVFTYSLCDGGTPNLCDTAVVTLTVTPVNDPPVAVDDTETTPEDVPVYTFVPGNDSDVDGALVPNSVAIVTPPAHGTVSVNPATGVIMYTPNADYNGTDSYSYIVCDNGTPLPALCDTAVVTLTVTPVNDPVVVTVTPITTDEDTPTGTICYPINDDPADDHTATICGATNGTATVSVNNGTDQLCVTFTPAADYYGPASICVEICDNGTPGLCDTINIPVTVLPVNDAPVANPDNATTPEDVPVTIAVPGNDSDLDGTLLPNTVAIGTQPSHGTVTVNAVTGEITYTPNPDYTGTDAFIYQICDNGTPLPGLCDTALVTVTVTPVNDAPVAVNDVNTTPEETAVNGNVAPNDSDVDGPGATFTLVTGPANGTLVLNTDGTYTYTPGTDFTGTDVFTYSLCDGGTPNQCDTATVTITVTPVNDVPVANPDNSTTPEDTPVTLTVLTNDSDADGVLVPNTVVVGTQPANGTVNVNNITGEIAYTPNPNFTGTDTFIYQVCDNGTPLPSLCDTALVTVTVTPVNDAPVANPDNTTTPEDTPVTINVPTNDTDVDGNLDPTTVAVTTPPTNGSVTVNPATGEVTYTPNPNFNGTDVFTYTICDTGMPVLCDTAVVTVTVIPVNDPPVFDLPNDSTNEDTPVTVCTPITDPDAGSVFTATVCGGPNNGTVSGPTVFNGQVCLTYTPATNFNGTDSICVIVCDNQGACDTSTTVITVVPVNDAPVANPDNTTTPEDTPVTINVPTNDTDVDGNLDPTTVAVATPPTNGNVTVNPATGEVTYTPNPNFNGTDVFTYSICDTGMPVLCDTAVVTVTVIPVNDPPVFDLPNDSTNEDTPVTVCTPITDPDAGSVFTATVCGGPNNGTVSGPSVFNGQVCLTYTPATNFNGTDSICVIVCDNQGACDTSTTVITVVPVNDAPVANPDNTTIPEDTPVTINVPSNDTDVDGNLDPTTVAVGTPPANGNVTVNPATGEVTYTPNPNFNGTDVFTYTICDTGMPVLCDTAVVTVTVIPVNDPPVFDLPNDTTNEDTPVTVCAPISDPDAGNTFSAGVCGGPVNGSISAPIVFNGQVCVTYTPNTNFNGTDSICIIVCDNLGACDTSTTVITVLPVNDPPVANPDMTTTPEDTPVTVNVPSNDTDVDGNLDSTTVAVGTPPANGNVTVNPATGEVTYTPNPNFNGTDVFTYSVCDTGMPVLCDTTTVSINVTPVNDPPVIDLPDPTTPEETPVTICSPISDPDAGNTFTATLCGGPFNGSVSGPTVFNGQVCITYTPAVNFTGTDSVCVIVCDNFGACDTSTTVITVTPVNDPPTATDDTDSTTTGTPVVIDVTGNDTDTDGGIDPTTVTIVTPPTQGTVTVNPTTGEVTYTPDANACGTDNFTYQVCDTGTPLPALCDQASVTVTIIDTEAPVIAGCPADITLTNDPGQCGAAATWTLPTVTDNCAGATLVSSHISGAVFPIGVSTVTYVATDGKGNTDTCSFTVTVTDTEDPTFVNCPGNITVSNLFNTCYAQVYWPTVLASDNCGNGGLTITSTHTEGEVFPVGITTVTYTVTDAAGNSATCSFTVTVQDTQAPTLQSCPADITVNNTPGACGAVVNWMIPQYFDNCPGAILTGSHTPGSTFPLGTTAVTYVVTDAAGNADTCTFTVTVTDAEAPAIAGCPANISTANDPGVCGAHVNWTVPAITDNCAGLTVTSTHNPGDLFPIGTTTVTYTATDAAGNVRTCSFTVTVTDNQRPLIAGCPGNQTVMAGAACSVPVNWTAPVASDNCGVVSFTSNYNPGDVFPVGTTTVIYTALDSAGNISTCSFDVTVSMPVLTMVYTNVSCNGLNDGTATVLVSNAVAPFTYAWSNAGTDSTLIGLAPGTYHVTVTDGIGCMASDTVSITEPEVFSVLLESVSVATCGFEDANAVVTTAGGTKPYSYAWSNGQATESLYNVADGVFNLLATDANGCQDSLTVTVTCEFGKVPQLLTPNGDGHNDVWFIPGIDKYPNAVVEVYNRWGNQVFKAGPYLNDWTGISAGMLNIGKDKLPAGTYFYVITLNKGEKGITGYLELEY